MPWRKVVLAAGMIICGVNLLTVVFALDCRLEVRIILHCYTDLPRMLFLGKGAGGGPKSVESFTEERDFRVQKLRMS